MWPFQPILPAAEQQAANPASAGEQGANSPAIAVSIGL